MKTIIIYDSLRVIYSLLTYRSVKMKVIIKIYVNYPQVSDVHTFYRSADSKMRPVL